jgi:hypothetical protein
VALRSDLSTLWEDFRRRWARPGSLSAQATAWLSEHPEVLVEFAWARDSDPLLRQAHNLSRRVVPVGPA